MTPKFARSVTVVIGVLVLIVSAIFVVLYNQSHKSTKASSVIATPTSTTTIATTTTVDRTSEDQGPGPMPAPCPANLTEPSMQTGSFCGPEPKGGNVCSGTEKQPPCGPGAIVGRYYDFSIPVTCSALVNFDGRKWLLSMPPPANAPPIPVWLRLDSDTSASFISPRGTESLTPYKGTPLGSC